jgi:saccharopine dehydrogenase-like NADP-dependent oxidoreductase
MKIMLLGAGAVGEGYGVLLTQADPKGLCFEKLVVADANLDRAKAVAQRLGGGDRFPAMAVNAGSQADVEAALRAAKVDLVMNGCPQHFNKEIFDAAFNIGCHYIDMAMSLSEPHPTDPFNLPGVLLGDYQYAKHEAWKEKGLLALLGMGIDPGVSELFARHLADHYFDEIDVICIRDGANLTVDGYRYATVFSAWSVMEECTNPPAFWSRERGYYTTEPMSGEEVFDFPEGIGPQKIVSVEHEEVINIPRWIDKGLKHVDFKIALGDDLVDALKLMSAIGLTSAEPVMVKGQKVVPRDLVEALLPNPAHIGPKMTGKISAGTLVKGRKDGKPREIYMYQVSDNQACMKRWGIQAVAIQTAVGPAIATELLAKGLWTSSGVLPPEAFDPAPFLARMAEYGMPYGYRDSWNEAR